MDKLYDNLMNVISEALSDSLSLNEMAKDISGRTIPRNLWLAVASQVSRARKAGDKECEDIRVMPHYADTAVQRYVAALLICKKPCPETVDDIAAIKTFKAMGHLALMHGARIDDIKKVYDENKFVSKASKRQSPDETAARQAPVQKAASGVDMKPVIERICNAIPSSLYNEMQRLYTGDSSYVWYSMSNGSNEAYNACKDYIKAYVQSVLKRSAGDVEKFKKIVASEYSQVCDFCGETDPEKRVYIKLSRSVGSRSIGGRWHMGFDHKTFMLDFTEAEGFSQRIKSQSSSGVNPRVSTYSYSDTSWLKTPDEYTISADVDYSDRKQCEVSMTDLLSKAFFANHVTACCSAIWDKATAKNASNSDATLRKYGLAKDVDSLSDVDVWSWFRRNIEDILKANPDTEVGERYGDWCGYVDYVAYSTRSKRCYAKIGTVSGNSDSDDWVDLYDLTRLSSHDTYRYRRVDKDYITWAKDPDDAIYQCIVEDLPKLARSVYSDAAEMVKEGKLK